MKLSRAVEPHHGAPAAAGSFPGAQTSYRDKLCESHWPTGLCLTENTNNSNSNSNNNSKNNRYSNCSSHKTETNHKNRRIESVRGAKSATRAPQHTPILESQRRTSSPTTRAAARAAAGTIECANRQSSEINAPHVRRNAGFEASNANVKMAVNMTAVHGQECCVARAPQTQTQLQLCCKATWRRTLLLLCALSAVVLLPSQVRCDDGDNFFAVNSFSMGPETTTPEFDYASRGGKKFGDKCDNTLECGFPGSICDPKKKSCQCTEDLPVTNHIDKCGKEAAVNESCFFNEQCEVKYFQTECRDNRCVCRFEMTPIWGKDGSVECKGRQDKRGPETYIDPAMIGVLVGMALMFIIICVVLRLFSQARWRENRTIFNTPNPRLMNVSLLRDSKLLHGQERRGSRMSVRAPSRQPSMASLRPHSPNPSLGSRSGSHGSNASATSIRSTRSNSVAPGNVNGHHERKGSAHHQHHQQQQQQQQHSLITNITSNPVAENVTVEIIEPGK